MEAAVICSIMISDNCGHLRAHILGWSAISTSIIVLLFTYCHCHFIINLCTQDGTACTHNYLLTT